MKLGIFSGSMHIGDMVDERKADDITISLLRDAKPEGMLRYIADAWTDIRNV